MSAPRPIPQGGDYRPHYRKRETDAFIAELEDQLHREREARETAEKFCLDSDHFQDAVRKSAAAQIITATKAIQGRDTQIVNLTAQVAQLTKERDEYKFMYEGLCK